MMLIIRDVVIGGGGFVAPSSGLLFVGAGA